MSSVIATGSRFFGLNDLEPWFVLFTGDTIPNQIDGPVCDWTPTKQGAPFPVRLHNMIWAWFSLIPCSRSLLTRMLPGPTLSKAPFHLRKRVFILSSPSRCPVFNTRSYWTAFSFQERSCDSSQWSFWSMIGWTRVIGIWVSIATIGPEQFICEIAQAPRSCSFGCPELDMLCFLGRKPKANDFFNQPMAARTSPTGKDMHDVVSTHIYLTFSSFPFLI